MRTSKTVTTKTYAIAKHTVTFVADGVTVKTMTVDEGYVLKLMDYPTIPPKPNYHSLWSYRNSPITADTIVTGVYIPDDEPDITIPPTPTTPPDIEVASVGDEEDVEESQADNASAEDAVSATAANSPVMELISTVTERHDYIYAGGKLLQETIITTAADGTVTVQVLDFAYDNAGSPYALTYTSGTTSTTYYYITNLQGDVMYLVEANGDTAAEYAYDAYGNITTATGSMAEINPLPYCGYGRLKTSFSWTSEMGSSFFVSSRTKFLQKQHMGLWWIFAPCRAYPLLFLEGSERPWKNTSRK